MCRFFKSMNSGGNYIHDQWIEFCNTVVFLLLSKKLNICECTEYRSKCSTEITLEYVCVSRFSCIHTAFWGYSTDMMLVFFWVDCLLYGSCFPVFLKVQYFLMFSVKVMIVLPAVLCSVTHFACRLDFEIQVNKQPSFLSLSDHHGKLQSRQTCNNGLPRCRESLRQCLAQRTRV